MIRVGLVTVDYNKMSIKCTPVSYIYGGLLYHTLFVLLQIFFLFCVKMIALFAHITLKLWTVMYIVKLFVAVCSFATVHR